MPRVDQYLLGRSAPVELAETAEGRADLTLSLSAPTTGTVRGTVTNAATADPVAGAIVKLMTPNGTAVDHRETNPAGNYAFDSVAPGSYLVLISATGFVTPAPSAFTVTGGKTVVVDLALTPSTSPAGAVYGTVTDAITGNALAGAPTSLFNISTGFTYATTLTDAGGEFLFCHVADGTYTVVTSLSGYIPSPTVEVTISGGDIAVVTFSLQPVSVSQATINGFIRNTAGDAIPNACVGVYSIDPTTSVETLLQVSFSDSGGRYLFNRIGAGTYVVKAKTDVEGSIPPGAGGVPGPAMAGAAEPGIEPEVGPEEATS